MAEILLDDWAAQNKIPKRTAQQWAKKRRIPAKLKRVAKTIVKTWRGYVIDDQATIPE